MASFNQRMDEAFPPGQGNSKEPKRSRGRWCVLTSTLRSHCMDEAPRRAKGTARSLNEVEGVVCVDFDSAQSTYG